MLLLLLALVVASQRLVATEWTSKLGLVSLLTIGGVLLGIPLGLSRFGGRTVLLLALCYSLVVVPFISAAVLLPGVPWLERMVSLGGRIGYAAGVLAAGEPLEDAFLFLALFSLGFWSLGVFSARALARSADFKSAVLPGAVVLILLQIFNPGGDRSVGFTALYLFFSLLLLGRMNYARRRETWQAWHLLSSGEARANINLTILGIAAVLVLAAWLMPISTRSIPLLRQWWQDLGDSWGKNESLDNVIAGLEIEDPIPVNEFYGRSLALGQEPSLSSTVYFRIQTTGVGGQERYYWRVRSYDRYQNSVWDTSPAYERGLTARSRSLQLFENSGVNAEFTFKVLGTSAGLLVTPARPIWISRPALLTFFPVGEDMIEPLFFRVNEPIQSGEEYLVHAVLMEPTVKQLRIAGSDYPDWVSDLYLQLPENLPPAISALAAGITAGLDNPYDKAAAITAYLRDTITYSLSVPLHPPGRDALAWFLFDYQQGYCNYYATAEVVMLRSVGVPARLVAGFGEGEYESPGWYTVRQRDAHAWPEVYFPGIGWVEFEPTTAEPELVRPSGEAPTPAATAQSIPLTPQVEIPAELPGEAEESLAAGGEGADAGGGQDTLAMLLVFFATIILLTGGLAWAYISGALERGYRRLRSTFHAPAPILAREWLEKNSLPVPAWLQRRAWLAGLSPLARLYNDVYRGLHGLKVPTTSAQTPGEAAVLLKAHLPGADEQVHTLLDEYQPDVYGTTPGSLEKAHPAAQSLRRMIRRKRRYEWRSKIKKIAYLGGWKEEDK